MTTSKLLTKEEAQSKINENVKKIYEIFAETEALADKYSIGFGFSPAYGMGGHYNPKKPMTREEALRLIKSGEELTQEQRDNIVIVLESPESDEDDWNGSGWVSSSQNC